MAVPFSERKPTSYRYNKVEPFMQKNPDTNHEPLEIEQLVKMGNIRGPCPFYLAREMARTADLVFMPYNYLIDSKNRSGLNMLRLENSILIFDEAHNVEVRLFSSERTIFKQHSHRSQRPG